MTTDDLLIIATGALVAISCALLGSFLLLRGMTMIGDAISHAVLPGIAIAYLVSGSRASGIMLAGAALFGLLTTAGIEWLRGRARLQADASIGIVFTGLFALGIVLISAYAGQIDLDLDCVLFGEIAYVPLDLWVLADGRIMGPVPIWLLGGLLLAIAALITFAYKPLLLTSFDPVHAAAAGISAAVWHYILMGFVSAATVLSFESVGAILVLSFLTGPPAAAFLLTRRLRPMLLLASGAGVLAAGLGYGLAVLLDGSIAGAMAVVIGAEFALALAWHLYRRRAAPVTAPGETA